MKKTLILLILMIGVATLHAQDTIVLRDSTTIEAKVILITESTVSYKKWKNLEGPTYNKSVEKVSRIRYANGTEDLFDAKKAAKWDSLQRVSRPFVKDARFQSYLSAGFFDGNIQMGVDGIWSCGVRIFDYGYVGLQTGFRYSFKYYDYWVIPLQVDLRGYYPINRMIHPYVEFSPGLELRILRDYWEDDYIQYFSYYVGAGFDIRRFSIGVGYYRGYYSHNFHVKMEVKIGRQ